MASLSRSVPSEQWEVAVPTAGAGEGGVQTLMPAAPRGRKRQAGLGPELGLRVDCPVPQPEQVVGLHVVSIRT